MCLLRDRVGVWSRDMEYRCGVEVWSQVVGTRQEMNTLVNNLLYAAIASQSIEVVTCRSHSQSEHRGSYL